MPQYTYTGRTHQLRKPHANIVVAFKVDPGSDPFIEKLTETTADSEGKFTLTWNNWGGRVIIGAIDDEEENNRLDCFFLDWQSGETQELSYNSVIESLSPALHYDFQNITGTTVPDLSDNERDGTVTPTATIGNHSPESFYMLMERQSYLSLNQNNNDSVLIPEFDFTSTGEFTIVMWVYMYGSNSNDYVFSHRQSGQPIISIKHFTGLWGSGSNSNMRFECNGDVVVETDGTGNQYIYDKPGQFATINMFTMRVKENDAFDIWKNDYLVESKSIGGFTGQTGGTLATRLGAEYNDTDHTSVRFYDFSIFDRKLTDTEVKTLFEVGANNQVVSQSHAVLNRTYNPDGLYFSGDRIVNQQRSQDEDNHRLNIPLSGRMYWEVEMLYKPSQTTNTEIGLMKSSLPNSFGVQGGVGPRISLQVNGTLDEHTFGINNPYSESLSQGDIVMFAYDADTGELWIGKNGTWFSGDPENGDFPTATNEDLTKIMYAGIALDPGGDRIRFRIEESELEYAIPFSFTTIEAGA